MELTALQSALLALLGASYATDGWEDAVLVEALAQGLAETNVWLPPLEATVTVTTAGHEQNIAALNAQQVLAVAYPWLATSSFRECAAPWRLAAPDVLYVSGPPPAVGDALRVRYRRRCSVAGLDGATATTLPAAAKRMLLLTAASHAYLIRYRQLSRRPSSAPSELQGCKELADIYRKQFEALVAGPAGAPPAWSQMGL